MSSSNKSFDDLAAEVNEAYARLSRASKIIIFILTPAIVVASILAFIWGAVSSLLGVAEK